MRWPHGRCFAAPPRERERRQWPSTPPRPPSSWTTTRSPRREWDLLAQDLHLACTLGVLTAPSPETRRIYLLGEVLAVPDRVGAEVAQVTPAAYRKRLERARRAVARRPASTRLVT